MSSLNLSCEQELALEALRGKVKALLSEKRYAHTASVEKTATVLAEILIPTCVYNVRVAAILHDVTKELPVDTHIELLKSSGIPLSEEDTATEGVLHSFSAPEYCRLNFAEYVNNDILSAIKNHTVGAPDMTLFDKIVFISDFIEETRRYEACVETRRWLLTQLPLAQGYEAKARCLDEACLMAILATEKSLNIKGAKINSRMLLTKDSLMQSIKQ